MTPEEYFESILKSSHTSWNTFLNSNKALLKEIITAVSKTNFTPQQENILRFLSVDLKNVKVIILGQDPYPQQGVATGRAFEVGTLKSWTEKFSNVSLKNIIRTIYKTQTGNALKYSEILKDKLNSSFHILSPNQLFKHWEKEGVLLLNTSFTCEIGKPGSHAKIWKPFTYNLLQYMIANNTNAYWFLWGDHAIKITQEIDIPDTKKIVSFHPMMCYDRENDFLYGNQNCFKKTWELINWTGFRNKKIVEITQAKLF